MHILPSRNVLAKRLNQIARLNFRLLDGIGSDDIRAQNSLGIKFALCA